MKDNSTISVLVFYMIIIIIFCFLPMLETIDFESLDLPWDHARITDVEYTAKVLDEPGTRRSSTCYRTTNF